MLSARRTRRMRARRRSGRADAPRCRQNGASWVVSGPMTSSPVVSLGGAARRLPAARRRPTRFRVWAPRASELALEARRGAPRARARGPRRLRGRAARRAPAATTPTSSTASASPTPARAGSPTACAGRRACSTRPRSRWTDDGFAPPPLARHACSTSCTSARSRAEGTFDGGDPAPARAARARRHRDRADAGRRVPRPPRLGLRRRLPLRRPLGLRRPARPRAARRRRPRRGPRGAPRRRPQPPRRVGRAGDGGLRPLPDRQVRDALGQGGQPRRRRRRTPCASGSCSPPSAGSATSTSTACGSTRSTR